MSWYSSEGDNTYSELLNLDLVDFGSLFLPGSLIRTAFPPPSSPPATLQSTDLEVPTLKHPCVAVAADLDIDNILPLEYHHRKHAKPAWADVLVPVKSMETH